MGVRIFLAEFANNVKSLGVPFTFVRADMRRCRRSGTHPRHPLPDRLKEIAGCVSGVNRAVLK
jgi:hypothetical protein